MILNGADFDDASVVDENVDAVKVSDGMVDKVLSLGGIGEIGRDEQDRFRGANGVPLEQDVAGTDEFIYVAGCEDEFAASPAEALGEGETEAARAAGDKDYAVILGR